MTSRPRVIKPDPRENKTTIQVTKDLKDVLTRMGLKGESYNQIIKRLVTHFEKQGGKPEDIKAKPLSGKVKIGENVVLSKYERVTISIEEGLYAHQIKFRIPKIALEVTYNKPFKKDDALYQIDLKINKVIFDNEIYSTKEFFGVLQKDIVYCDEFVFYYLRALLEVIWIEFKKSNYIFRDYASYFDLANWRTHLLNSNLSPEILSSDVESVLSDLKNKKTNKQLLKDVKNSYYYKLQASNREYYLKG